VRWALSIALFTLSVCLSQASAFVLSFRCDDCLQDKKKDYHNCSVLCFMPQLGTVVSSLLRTNRRYNRSTTNQNIVLSLWHSTNMRDTWMMNSTIYAVSNRQQNCYCIIPLLYAMPHDTKRLKVTSHFVPFFEIFVCSYSE